ncbi:MAG: 16S rRNA (cytidine(1402)-2'-O)-methyltransferase [Helicobacter sp.]|nr:16S rRNA (cytidine(1402)-2'-O)-methyltransferase [Helicobacteraceae bacterium]MDY3113903.1 16S rRNA (cytidine(1402)-2'-O)-methyltransferase [Helicobacter sp.]
MVTFLPTPIGNLQDITLNTLQTLQNCEVLLCEDTRVSKKLIKLLEQKELLKPREYEFLSFHTHNQNKFLFDVSLDFFNKNICFLSDAGMPCVSDPGVELVRYLQKNKLPYQVLGGISAVTLAVAFSGIVEKEFCFLGFLPHKLLEKRQKLQEVLNYTMPSVIYESPHRLLQTLEILAELSENREIFVAKELTKKFQNTFKGSAKSVYNCLKKSEIKGEWVLVLAGAKNVDSKVLTESQVYSLEIPPKIKAKILAKMHDKKASDFYNKIVENG